MDELRDAANYLLDLGQEKLAEAKRLASLDPVEADRLIKEAKKLLIAYQVGLKPLLVRL